MYSLSDPTAIKQIYSITSPMIKGPWYKIFGDPQRPNLFSETDRHLHASMRKAVANLYTMTAIKSYERYADNCVTVLQEQFDRLAAEGAAIHLQRWMQAYAFDVIGEITVRLLSMRTFEGASWLTPGWAGGGFGYLVWQAYWIHGVWGPGRRRHRRES